MGIEKEIGKSPLQYSVQPGIELNPGSTATMMVGIPFLENILIFHCLFVQRSEDNLWPIFCLVTHIETLGTYFDLLVREPPL